MAGLPYRQPIRPPTFNHARGIETEGQEYSRVGDELSETVSKLWEPQVCLRSAGVSETTRCQPQAFKAGHTASANASI